MQSTYIKIESKTLTVSMNVIMQLKGKCVNVGGCHDSIHSVYVCSGGVQCHSVASFNPWLLYLW